MIAELTLPTDLPELRPVSELIAEVLQTIPYSEHDIFSIKLAVEEALNNAIEHGNRMDPDKWVNVVFTATSERFDIRITDEGQGFDPEDTDDPPGVHTLRHAFGRGLLLMRGFMTEVRSHGRGNVVTMAKVREASA